MFQKIKFTFVLCCLAFVSLVQASYAQPTLTCADITEIPATECQALQALVTANPSA